MRTIAKDKRRSQGFTLVEALVAGTVSVIVVMGTFAYLSYSGETTKETKATQQLQIQSSLISESFLRTLRASKIVMAGTDTSSADTGTVTAQAITAMTMAGPVTIRISDSAFVIQTLNGVDTLAKGLVPNRGGADSLNRFRVYKGRKEVDLFYATKQNAYTGPLNVIRGRCKNYSEKIKETPPDYTKLDDPAVKDVNQNPDSWGWVPLANPPANPSCGTGGCEAAKGENFWTCPWDCPTCGSPSSCDAGENYDNCPGDCQTCGDGDIDAGENWLNCPQDVENRCGNGACNEGENQTNCPADCGTGGV